MRWYVYAWRGGPLVMSKVGGERPKLDDEGLAALAKAKAERNASPPSTFKWLIDAWRASPEWANLSKTTRQVWGRVLSTIETKWGKFPMAIFNDVRMRAKVIAWRNQWADRPRTADYHIQVLRALLEFGRVPGHLALNVAEGIPQLYKGGNRQNILWEPAEIEAFLKEAPVQVADILRLAILTGFRRKDLAELTWDAVKENAIIWRTSKGRGKRTANVPILPELRELLAELKTRKRKAGVESVLVTSRGTTWVPDGLDSSFQIVRRKINSTKHLHDCRGTFATKLCLAGLTDDTVGRVLGWTPSAVAELRAIYVDDARTVVAIGARLASA